MGKKKYRYGAPVKNIFNMKDNVRFIPQYYINKDYVKKSEFENMLKISVPSLYMSTDGKFESQNNGDLFYDKPSIPPFDGHMTLSGKSSDKSRIPVSYGWFVPGEIENPGFQKAFKRFIRVNKLEYTVEIQRFGFNNFSYFVMCYAAL